MGAARFMWTHPGIERMMLRWTDTDLGV